MSVQPSGIPEKTKPLTWVVLGIFVLFGLLLIIGFLSPSPTRTVTAQNSGAGAKALRGTYWCGVTFEDARRISIAVSRQDTMAVAGLLARGQAFEVEAGTRVVSGGEIDMGISLATIESGFQMGRKCYISTRALQ
jgi:hypothetical protein